MKTVFEFQAWFKMLKGLRSKKFRRLTPIKIRFYITVFFLSWLHNTKQLSSSIHKSKESVWWILLQYRECTGQCIVINSSPVNNVRHHYIMLVVLQESFLSKCSSEYFEYGYLERKVLRSTNIKDNNPSTPAQAIYYVKLTAPVVRPQPQGYHVHQLLNTSHYIIMKVIQLHL